MADQKPAEAASLFFRSILTPLRPCHMQSDLPRILCTSSTKQSNDHMEASAPDPILFGRPPATDSLNYLILVEHNVNEHNVDTLHGVLVEDHELTATIGWDLVQILLPLVPSTNDCLRTISKLGNPREVILKVTEALLSLKPDFDESESLDSHPDVAVSQPKPMKWIQQYSILLEILPTLHKRIKARRPSRFLATSLRAVSATYQTLLQSDTDTCQITSETIAFAEASFDARKPRLPPRRSVGDSGSLIKDAQVPDPEGSSSGALVPTDSKVSGTLIVAFLVKLFEVWSSSLALEGDVPGLGLADRVRETLGLDRSIPGRATMNELFANRPDLRIIEGTVRQFRKAGALLDVTAEFLHSIMHLSDQSAAWLSEEDTPEVVEDVDFSKNGAVLMLAVHALDRGWEKSTLHDHSYVFPHYHTMLMAVANPEQVSLENGSLAVLDAIVAIGLQYLQVTHLGDVPHDDAFFRHLQALTTISASSLSPRLRYNAHLLASATLQQHPSERVRLAFIRDTLEHCPYDNLKVCAIGWFKQETMQAFDETNKTPKSIFRSQDGLQNISSHMFPDFRNKTTTDDSMQTWLELRSRLSFHMAILNLYFLLISRPDTAQCLEMVAFHSNKDISGSYLKPLRQMCKGFGERLRNGNWHGLCEREEDVASGLMDLSMLDACLDQVDQSVLKLSARQAAAT